MPLDPEMAELMDPIRSSGIMGPFHGKTVDEIRELEASQPPPPTVDVHRREDRTISGPNGPIPIRIYASDDSSELPVLVFLHGGGFVLCSIDSHDAICAEIANSSKCMVVSVGYRLAPESKFPIPVEDCYAATKWVSENAAEIGGDHGRIAIAGDSAGGNLAAGVTLMARDRGGPTLAFQLLIYPNLDYESDRPSMREREDYLFAPSQMSWFWNHYMNSKSDAQNPYCVPHRASQLSELPKAHIVVAEYDFLKDEGVDYGKRLIEDGVRTTISYHPGLVHGFLGMEITQARYAMAEICERIRLEFG